MRDKIMNRKFLANLAAMRIFDYQYITFAVNPENKLANCLHTLPKIIILRHFGVEGRRDLVWNCKLPCNKQQLGHTVRLLQLRSSLRTVSIFCEGVGYNCYWDNKYHLLKRVTQLVNRILLQSV